jgi:tetratricopeptide (TPR) repeat protein
MVLSTLSEQVLRELTIGSHAVARQTSVKRIQGLVGGDVERAHVVVAELEAAGHVTKVVEDEQRLRLHVPPLDANLGLFRTAVEVVADEAKEADRLLRAGGELDVGAWIAAQGVRVQASLTAGWEHGWHDIVWLGAAALARLLRAAGHPEQAGDAVYIGMDALNRLYKEHLAALWELRAAILSDLHQHEEADRASTVALVHALETADDELVATAYSCRASVRNHAGRLGDAVDDYDQAVAATRRVGGERSEPAQRMQANAALTARFDAALTQLEHAAGLHSARGGRVDHARMLSILSEVLGYAEQVDPAAIRLARAVRALQELIPSQEAADILMMVARHAERTGQLALARESYEQVIARYIAAGQPQQADVVRAQLSSLNEHDSPTGGAE